MKITPLLFKATGTVILTVLFASLNSPHLETARLEALQAAQKPNTVSNATKPMIVAPAQDSQLKTPDNPKPVDPPPAPEPAAAPMPPPQPVVTDHETMMQEAGIAQGDWPAAEQIISMESAWNVDATEPTTGACGLAQELPCGKSGCGRLDGVCQLQWANQYVTARYGGWVQALNFHYVHGWY